MKLLVGIIATIGIIIGITLVWDPGSGNLPLWRLLIGWILVRIYGVVYDYTF